ncbi:hypothetical protein LOC68_10945 [Blastopirellula sp. JC732]|uniref:Uncharacterized protein n=1 Tax=Blastopirellula sediminis TaxID=2894196 RepID=A0A9X1SGF1_9BACT|nr:hypothetical protein [Blastopirellula sediminis]MCC9628917.1 hypothetical protein [Blastopirellula sediminis]
MAEQAFVEELDRLVFHLTERLTGEADGQPKVFRDSANGNLQEFFTRFQSLKLRSNEQPDSLFEQCQQIVQGVRPQTLRNDAILRRRVGYAMLKTQTRMREKWSRVFDRRYFDGRCIAGDTARGFAPSSLAFQGTFVRSKPRRPALYAPSDGTIFRPVIP